MRRERKRRKSKTLKDIRVMKFEFVKDESSHSVDRSDEAINLIAQMIELSHKRGRPSKEDQEFDHAA